MASYTGVEEIDRPIFFNHRHFFGSSHYGHRTQSPLRTFHTCGSVLEFLLVRIPWRVGQSLRLPGRILSTTLAE